MDQNKNTNIYNSTRKAPKPVCRCRYVPRKRECGRLSRQKKDQNQTLQPVQVPKSIKQPTRKEKKKENREINLIPPSPWHSHKVG